MKRNLTIVSALLGIVWVVATGVFPFFAAGIVPIPWLLVAFGAMDGAFGLALALLITTNTRVAWPFDPYAATTDELLRQPLRAHEDRRVRNGTVDDRGVVQRLSDILEDEAAKRPRGETPAWVIGVSHDRADDAFPDEPKEET